MTPSCTYLDYSEKITVNKGKKRRKTGDYFVDIFDNFVTARQSDNHVARVSAVTPDMGDIFYLRLLLHHKPARSFEELRTHDDTEYPTFQDAARSMGIIQNDEEYQIWLQEAINFRTGKQLRYLFVALILDGAPANFLWEQFQSNFTEDLRMSMSDAVASVTALREIDLALQHHGRTNDAVGLPSVIHLDTEYLRFKHQFDTSDMQQYTHTHLANLSTEQRQVFDKVVASVTSFSASHNVYMIDAPAGTGKTCTEKVICSHLRPQERLVLCVASTGIAGLQLPGGWTAHSMFKLPLEEKNVHGSMCNISAESQRAEVLRKCDLIVWDEIPMSHRFSIEALNLTLQDLMDNTLLMGGKTVLFSGDLGWACCKIWRTYRDN